MGLRSCMFNAPLMEQVLGHQRVWNLTHSKAPQLPLTLIPQRYFSRSVKQKTSIFPEIPAVDKMSTYHDHAARRRAHWRAHLSSTMDADVDHCTARSLRVSAECKVEKSTTDGFVCSAGRGEEERANMQIRAQTYQAVPLSFISRFPSRFLLFFSVEV